MTAVEAVAFVNTMRARFGCLHESCDSLFDYRPVEITRNEHPAQRRVRLLPIPLKGLASRRRKAR